VVKISISIFLFKDSLYVTEILSVINEFRLLSVRIYSYVVSYPGISNFILGVKECAHSLLRKS
jgi:hypothetical protein